MRDRDCGPKAARQIKVAFANESIARDETQLLPKFLAGEIVVTAEAARCIPFPEIDEALFRHLTGDWGAIDSEDRRQNEAAFKNGGTLFTRHESTAKIVFWIITEANRSLTTILLPKDY